MCFPRSTFLNKDASKLTAQNSRVSNNARAFFTGAFLSNDALAPGSNIARPNNEATCKGDPYTPPPTPPPYDIYCYSSFALLMNPQNPDNEEHLRVKFTNAGTCPGAGLSWSDIPGCVFEAVLIIKKDGIPVYDSRTGIGPFSVAEGEVVDCYITFGQVSGPPYDGNLNVEGNVNCAE